MSREKWIHLLKLTILTAPIAITLAWMAATAEERQERSGTYVTLGSES